MTDDLDVSRAIRIDRELIVTHLSDLLSLHVAQDALTDQIASGESGITRLNQEQRALGTDTSDKPREPPPPSEKAALKPQPLGWFPVLLGLGGAFISYPVIMLMADAVGGSRSWGPVLAGLVMLAVAIGVPVKFARENAASHRASVSSAEWSNEKARQDYNRRRSEYVEKLEEWNRRRAARVDRIPREREQLAKQLKLSRRELDRVTTALQNAYAINIIPAPFRSTAAIYYLVDYLSTSRETMSSALLHANLEDIKRRLDQVIRNQRMQMVQQALDSARLVNLSEAVGQTNREVATVGGRMGELIGEATALRATSEQAVRHMENAEHYAQISAAHLASIRYWQQTRALDNHAHQ